MIRSLALCPLALAVSAMSFHAAAEESFALEEVVVTAQKRAQSLQDVPISVSAVGGEKLAEAGIENLQDLSAYVPNLKIVEGGLVPQMYIRGIGSGANQGFEQSVGTYSDGVYMGRSMQSRSSFMDLERVEVLRGPQSILFGQSSIAGAISLVSAKPTEEFEAMISASHAPEYDETEINAYVSGPITDNFRARLAVRDRQEDGYLENPLMNTDGPNMDEQAARLTLDWDVSDNFNAVLKLETARIERKNGRPGQVVDLGDYPLVVPGLEDNAKLDLKQYSTTDNKMSFDSDAALLKLEYEFNNGLTLTSLTSYSEYEYKEPHYDGESSEVNIVDMDLSEDFDQFSQEIRLTSPGGETVDYIVGAFYQESEQQYNEDARLTVSSLGLPTPLDSLVERPFTQDSETWALFAQATWNISEELRMTFGLRYTEDEKQGTRNQNTYSINNPGVLQSNVSIVNGLPCDAGGVCAVPAQVVATTLGGGFNLIDHSLKGDNSKSNWTPSINVQYDLTPDIMLYATYTEGYKAGGFDARGINGASGTGADNPFGYGPIARGGDNFEYSQEEAETIELGAKMTLLDGTAELNAAFYQTDYTDMQVSIYDGTFGFNVFNAGEATVRGMELDGRWRPTQNILLTAGLAYLDFEWTEYSEAVCPGVGSATLSSSGSGNCDAKGSENLQTPEWTANLSASHTLPVGDSMELRSTLDANFKDNHYTSNDLDARGEQSASTIYNMRFALASTDDTWQVALIGKNLTDKRIMNYNVSLTQGAVAGTDADGNGIADGGRTAQVNRPRTIAIEGTYRF
jgi:iron complex outermembrane recepter protein